MVKATLRTSKTAPIVDVEATVVGQAPSSTVTAPAPAGVPAADLTDAIPSSEPAEPAQEPALPRALAPRTPSAVSMPAAGYGGDGLEGDWSQDDLKYPQLKIVQGSGPLSRDHDNGTILYNDIELLPPPSVKAGAVNTALRFVPVVITKQFREKLSDEEVKAGEMPRIFNSVREVEDAGLTTRWVGSQRPDNFAEPSAKVLLLLEQPEGIDHPGFILTMDGKQYAAALYYAAGGAFRDSAKIIFNTALTSLLVPVLGADNKPVLNPRGGIVKKPMLYKNFWTLNFVKKDINGFVVWRPVVKLLGKEETGAEVRAYCENLIHSAPQDAATAE